jgi:hypothetical protein
MATVYLARETGPNAVEIDDIGREGDGDLSVSEEN